MALGTPFRRLFLSSTVANLGDGFFTVALPLLAVRLTDSPLALAGVTAAATLPWLVVALPAGAAADRLDRKRTMVRVGLLRVLLACVLAAAVALDVASIPLLWAVALVGGTGEVFFDIAAQSILPMVVGKDDLAEANGRLFGGQLVANQLAGPPVGGLLAASSLTWPFAAATSLYAASVAWLAAVPGSFKPARTGPRTSVRADVVEGVRYVWSTPVLRTFAGSLGVLNMAATAWLAVFPLYALRPGPMGLGATGFGLLMAGGAVGGVAASWAAGRIERRLGRSRLLAIGIIGSGICLAVPAVTANAVVIGVVFAVTGAAGVLWNVVTVSFRQTITPDHLLGRMNASYRLVGWGTMPIGSLIGGVVAEVWGLRAVAAGAALAHVALFAATRRHLSERALAAAEAAAGNRPPVTGPSA